MHKAAILVLVLSYFTISNARSQGFNASTDSLVLINQGNVGGGFLASAFQYKIIKKPAPVPQNRLKITAPLLVAGSGMLFMSSSMYRNQQDWHRRSVRSFRTTADDYLAFAPDVLSYGFDLAGIKAKNSFKDRVILSASSKVLMFATVYGLKYLTQVKRPDGSNNLSFPSSHTALAFSGAQMLHEEYGHKSIAYSIGGYTLAAGTGFLRMVNNKHWFSDVLTGAGLGMLSTKLSYVLVPKIKKKFSKKK